MNSLMLFMADHPAILNRFMQTKFLNDNIYYPVNPCVVYDSFIYGAW